MDLHKKLSKIPTNYQSQNHQQIIERNKQLHLPLSPNFNSFQSAYLSFRSTKTAMTKLANDLLTAVDSGKPSIVFSLDISAVFDMLNHTPLLKRATEVF